MDPEQITELSQQTLDIATTYFTEYGMKVLAALLIFVIGRIVVGFLTSLIDRAMHRSGVDPTITSFLHNLIYSALFAFVILAALAKLGIQTASFIAVLGAAGLAIGLALQGSLSNFAAGVMLILFRPFKVGDFIESELDKILSAITNDRAKTSIPPMCAIKISSKSVEFLRVFASKLIPP